MWRSKKKEKSVTATHMMPWSIQCHINHLCSSEFQSNNDFLKNEAILDLILSSLFDWHIYFHARILFQEKNWDKFFLWGFFLCFGCLSHRYSVSKRTYAYMHVYVCVFSVFWIFFCFLFCCCRCCGVSMPLFLNTGEKLCFFLLLCVDSMSLVSHKMYTYIHAQSLNFIQFHSTMWNHHHHLYAIWWFVCEFLLTTDRELTASCARTHTHTPYTFFFSIEWTITAYARGSHFYKTEYIYVATIISSPNIFVPFSAILF